MGRPCLAGQAARSRNSRRNRQCTTDCEHSQDHDWFDPDTSNKINDILALALLRSQMNELLHEEQITSRVSKSRSLWRLFLQYLNGVILEKPLIIKDPTQHNITSWQWLDSSITS